MTRKPTAQRAITGIAALVVVAIACNAPTTEVPSEPTIMGQPPTLPSNETTAPTEQPPTVPAEATTTPTEQPPDAPAPNAEFEGISFHFEPALVSSWKGVITDLPPSDSPLPIPSHYRITLEGYPVDSNWEAVIQVFPVENIQQQNASLMPIHDNLKTILENRESTFPVNLPFIPPFFEGGFSFYANKAYINFQNGSGIRYLTHYVYAFLYLNNMDLIYVYQGLTNDDKYYVSIMLPVTHPSLPPDDQWEDDPNFDPSATDYNTYVIPVVQMLEETDRAGFNPTLEALDTMMQSLKVEP